MHPIVKDADGYKTVENGKIIATPENKAIFADFSIDILDAKFIKLNKDSEDLSVVPDPGWDTAS